MHLSTNGNWWSIIWMAILTFLVNPLHYVVTGLIIWDLVRNVRKERAWFGVRVTRIGKTLVVRYLKSATVGLVASVGMIVAGVTVRWQDMLFVSLLSLGLGLIRSRFAASPFTIAIAVLAAQGARVVPWQTTGWELTVLHFLRGFPIESWLFIGGVGALGECLLQWWNAKDAVLPALVTSRRGRRIGALKIQMGFVLPVVVWMTPMGHASIHFLSGTHPWLLTRGGVVSLGVLPLVFGMHALMTSLNPERVLVQLRWWNLVFAVVFGAGFATEQWLTPHRGPAFGWLAALVLIIVLECFRWLWRRVDASSEPLCSPDARGVMVLYTIRNSLSEKLGLKPGEMITHVNQAPVHTEYDLHFAFEQNPAYAKFQVIDRKGELRLIGNPVFEGERHQLGLLLVVPDDQPALRLSRPFGFLETLYLRTLRNAHRNV